MKITNYKNYKKMDLLEGLRMLLLNLNFVMVYIIHKILYCLRIIRIILKIIFWNAFLRSQ